MEPLLTQESSEHVLAERARQIEALRPTIGRKILYMLEEKLHRERAEFQHLLDAQSGKNIVLQKYTFVLDPNYFEQIFLPERT